jgi:hypothetical protein
LSHYKTGADFYFLKLFNFEVAGYENLPFGNQKIYSRVPVRHKNGTPVLVNGKRTFQWVYTGKAILEDHGLTCGLAVYPRPRVTLFGFYQRSLNQSYGSTTFGVSYMFGKSKRETRELADVP